VTSLTGTFTVTINVSLFTVGNFHVAETTEDSITLQWDNATWVEGGYRIYRYNTGTYVWDLITSPADGDTAYTDTGLTLGTTYSYEICGLYGSPVTEGTRVSTSASPTLSAPQNVSAVVDAYSANPFQVQISWDTVTGANQYRIYRDGSFISTSYGTTYSDTATKTFGNSYTYQVVAYNSTYYVQSAYSASSWVSFPITDNLWLGSTYYGAIDAPGEVDLYRFDVPYNTSYLITLEEYGFDAYVRVYRNGGLVTTIDSGSYGYYSWYPGDEVIVAVTAYSAGNTGSYGVRIDY
jgi:hypothetical protein